jgi:hypothetical protein
MQGVLAPSGRFGSKVELAAQPTPADFIDYLFAHRFQSVSSLAPFAGAVLPGPLKAILGKYLPPPQGVTADTFYAYYRALEAQAPPPDFQPQAMAAEIWERVVLPVQAASSQFETLPTLTRLYSTISPADMNKDPAFSFNPSLPAVSNVHRATMTVSCSRSTGQEESAVLTTEQGWDLPYPNGRFAGVGFDRSKMPASLVIEVLREEGSAQNVVNNVPLLDTPPKGCGCDASGAVALAAIAVVLLRRRAA